MMPDIERLASSIAQTRQDPTCFALQHDELVAECRLKLAHLVNKNRLASVPNRKEAFKFIKTVFNNHCKSLVAKYRMTGKRGYIKNQDSQSAFAAVKNVDLSLDDPEQPVHLADSTSTWSTAENFVEDISPYLTPIELLLLKEFNEPCARTRFFSDLDYVESSKSRQHVYKISESNYAQGLGLEFPFFKKILTELRKKISWITMKEATPTEIAWNSAIARLEEIFSIVIPYSIDKAIVRRMLTLAAVDSFDKVEGNEQVIKDLQFIGAKVPEKRVGTLSCYGIMFQEKNQTCGICGQAQPCKQEAINHGLGDIVIDAKLLGAKQVRIPTLVARSQEPFPILTFDEEKIFNHLMENFTPQATTDGVIFNHKDVNGISVTLQRTPQFELKISRPCPSIMASLVKRGQYYVISPELDADDVIEIIGEYSHNAFVTMTT
jgi:hypothetical protein